MVQLKDTKVHATGLVRPKHLQVVCWDMLCAISRHVSGIIFKLILEDSYEESIGDAPDVFRNDTCRMYTASECLAGVTSKLNIEKLYNVHTVDDP